MAENRLEFIRLILPGDFPPGFEADTLKYLQAHLETEDFLCCVALEEERIVSGAMLCLYEEIPTVGNPGGKSGYLYNVYTVEEFRGRGLIRQVLKMLLEEAAALGTGMVHLDYTEDGRKTYENLGFKHSEHRMQLDLRSFKP